MKVLSVFVVIIGAIAALPTDTVIRKLDPEGPRYEYVRDEDGRPHLLDSWVKLSDLEKMARYNPDTQNQYHLFTRSNPNLSQPIVINNTPHLATTNFDPSKRTIITIHGFLGSATAGSNQALVPAYLAGEDVNVIVVDWSAGAYWGLNGIQSGRAIARFINWLNSVTGARPEQYHIIGFSVGGHSAGVTAKNVDGNIAYVTAYLAGEDVNVIVVDWSAGAYWGLNGIQSGRAIARFINWLNSVTGARPEQYHIIGFSVGGHSAGVTAKNVDGNIAYVTGLDPSSRWEDDELLSPSDATYVEVIHTSAGVNGWGEPLGHVDFYPNGGRNMPGCLLNIICDHNRSYYFMAESVATGGFMALRCPTYWDALIGDCWLADRLQMGGRTPKTGSSGIFGLRTNRGSPYSQG